MEIHGTCRPGFEAVRDAFEANSALACGGTVDGVRLLSEAGARRAWRSRPTASTRC